MITTHERGPCRCCYDHSVMLLSILTCRPPFITFGPPTAGNSWACEAAAKRLSVPRRKPTQQLMDKAVCAMLSPFCMTCDKVRDAIVGVTCLQSYPEFCRSAFDTAGPSVRDAIVELERKYGKVRHTLGTELDVGGLSVSKIYWETCYRSTTTMRRLCADCILSTSWGLRSD